MKTIEFILKALCNGLVIWLLWGWFAAGIIGPSLSFFQVLGLYMLFLLFVENQGTVSKCSIEKDGFFNQNTIADTLLEIANKPLIVLGMGYFATLSM